MACYSRGPFDFLGSFDFNSVPKNRTYFSKTLSKSNSAASSVAVCTPGVQEVLDNFSSCPTCMDNTHIGECCQFRKDSSDEEGQYSDTDHEYAPNPNVFQQELKDDFKIGIKSSTSTINVEKKPTAECYAEDYEFLYKTMKLWMKRVLTIDTIRQEIFKNHHELASDIVQFL